MRDKKAPRGTRHDFLEDSRDWMQALQNRENGSFLLSFPDIEARSFWDGLDPEMRRQVSAYGESLLTTPYPVILLSDYMEFSRNGNRSRFEQLYFGRRKMLTALVLAECVQNNGQFLGKILDGLYLIMEEVTWCLPAHNSYIRDTPQLPVPDCARPVIDLFAAETGAILATACGLLHSRFDKISPFIGSALEDKLKERIILPYLSYHFWWMGDGLSPMLNWTPWITQNVLLTAFGLRHGFLTADQEKKILEQATVSLDYFLDEYGDDGCCDEGAQYFSHAGLCLFGCIDILSRLTGKPRTGLYGRPLIRNMADYILRVYAGNGYYFNFADCSAHPGHRNARDYLFARHTGNEALAEFAAADYRSCTWEEKLIHDEENLYYHLLQLSAHAQMTDAPDHGRKASDSWFESTGILISRDESFSLAARAGSNGDSHNHNDVGSVIVYKNGKPFLIDLGVETYTRKTFSPERYEIWTMQSSFHNLPTFFDGETPIQQKAGPEYEADSVTHRIGEEESFVAMELAPVYADPRVVSYKRRAALRKGDSVRIEDRYEGGLPCRLSLMLAEEPSVCGRGADSTGFTVVIQDVGRIEIEGASDILTERVPIGDPKLRAVWGQECFRVLIGFQEQVNVILK